MLDSEQIRSRLAELGDFYHNVTLPFGIETKPGHTPARGDNFSLLIDALPHSMDGLSVLDLGCNAGAFSIEAKKRGASRVVGIDYSEKYIKQARFCADVLQLDIEYHVSDVHSCLQEFVSQQQKFDCIIFVGTLYHLLAPIEVPRLLGKVARQSCLVETVGVLPEYRNLPGNLIQLPRPKISHSGTVWMNIAAMNHIFMDLSGFSSSQELFNGSRIAALYTK